jgi:hypothetical protein
LQFHDYQEGYLEHPSPCGAQNTRKPDPVGGKLLPELSLEALDSAEAEALRFNTWEPRIGAELALE